MTYTFLYYPKIPCLGALTIYMSQGVGLSCLKFNELGCTHTYVLPIGFGMGLVNVFLPLSLIPFWDFYSMYVDTLLPGPSSCLFSILHSRGWPQTCYVTGTLKPGPPASTSQVPGL